MNVDIDIRFATQKDARRVLEIYAPYILESPASFETEVPSLKDFEIRIAEVQGKFPWIVCEVDGRVAGYAYAGAHRSRCAYEWSVESSVYLDPAHHGKGIGTKLYKELFALLKEQGAVNIFAGITLPNKASVRLHESLGFTFIGEFKDIGFKLGQWWNVGWWQLQLQKPQTPACLKPPRKM